MSARQRTCRVCGCTDRNACRTDDGPCFWVDTTPEQGDVCSACAPVLDHPRMRMHSEGGAWRATCGCGWTFAAPFGMDVPDPAYADREAAVVGHWLAVVAEAAG